MLFWFRNAQKKAQINFDQHEELVTELYPINDLKEMVKKGDYSLNWSKFNFYAFLKVG